MNDHLSSAPSPAAGAAVAVDPSDIAVIGIACRFPGAPDPEAFWRNLAEGVESVEAVPAPSGAPSDGRVRAAAVLPGIEDFDASFFGYSPREAELLDPQHRVFLECAWEAIEDAGYHPAGLQGTMGVYGGSGLSTYLINHVYPQRGSRSDANFLDSMADLQLAVATDRDYLASRVSYKLDLTGPAVAVQAACATSLYAVHLACQALLNGECDTALAGAVSIPVPQIEEYAHEPGMVFSPDGHCRAFDEDAEGTVFGSGAGVILLKPLQEALADGDSVYAVIKGSAINNDGGRKAGYTAPSVQGQASVIEAALEAAAIDGETIGYVEAHGTGTTLGDPIEVAALTQAYGTDPGTHRCGIGTVKTNIGHLGWAAGMAGLIKTALALHHRRIPASLNFRRPNPRIGFDHTPFHVVTELTPWEAPSDTPRRAGVSAFGLGGANAHLVMEEAPRPPEAAGSAAGAGSGARLLPLSAASSEALAELTGRYRERLAAGPELPFADLAATAALGRRHFPHRAAVVATDTTEALARLVQRAEDGPAEPGNPAGHAVPRIAALFSGQGGEYLGMGRELYATEPVFRSALDACDPVLREYLGTTAADFLYATEGIAEISRIAHAQPLVFALQTALFELWESWGIRPDVVMGHSLGEYAAAWAAGVFSREDGLRLVAERGRLLQSLPENGSMAAVLAGEGRVRELLDASGRVAIAAVNGPMNTVISGRAEAVRAAAEQLRGHGLEVKELRISRAGHCELMDPVLDAFEEVVRGIRLSPPRLTLISNLTGAPLGEEITDPLYWRRHLREPVRFLDGLTALAGLGIDVAVEMGAAPVLTGVAAAALPESPVLWLPSLRPGHDDRAQILTSLGALYERGADVSWEAVHPDGFRRGHLPTYPFQRRRHWIEAQAGAPRSPAPAAPAARPAWQDWLYDTVWEQAPMAPGPADLAEGAGPAGPWLLCGGPDLLAEALAERIRQAGGRVAHAAAEHVDFGSRDAVARHLDGLPEQPRALVNLLALDPDCPTRTVGAGTLHLFQALAERSGPPVRTWLVTRGAQPADGRVTEAGAVQAALWGMARVAVIEHPDLLCTRVDLDPTADYAAEASALLYELTASPAESEVAVRGGERLLPRLIARPDAGATAVRAIAPDGTYLVTGGLRGVGLLAAERLAAAGAGRIVLLGRTGPDDRARSVIATLRGRGHEVETVRADVSDAAQVRQALARAATADRPLRGIVHAAGVLDDATLGQLDWTRFETVLAPKADGAWHLHRITAERGDPLDLFVLFSSTTGLIGNSGQANHAAANARLDALAHHRRAAGLPATTVNWGAWSDTGFLAGRPDTLEKLARIGMGGIDRHSGAALIDRVLHAGEPRIVVAPVDWPVFLDHLHLTGLGFFSAVTATAPGPGTGSASDSGSGAAVPALPGQLASCTAEERLRLLEREVRRQLERVLGTATDLNPGRSLVEYGMDSLSSIQIRNGLQRSLAQPLPADLCFRYPSPARLVDHLSGLSYPAPQSAVAGASAEDRTAASTPQARPGLPAADVSPPAGTSATGALPGEVHDLSLQQSRWLKLLSVDYGRLLVPILFGTRLDRRVLRAALTAVADRHDVLRWRFEGGKAVEVSLDEVLPGDRELFTDLRSLTSEERSAAVTRHAEHLRTHLPDPAAGVPWTVTCLELSDTSFLVVLGLQHLEFDGVSVSVFTDDLRTAYLAALKGEAPFPEPAPRYADFIAWQSGYLAGPVREDRAFFSGLYTDSPGPTMLPDADGTAGNPADLAVTRGHDAARLTPDVDEALWPDLVAAAGRTGVSPFSLMAAVYARLISRITGHDAVTLGTIVTGRPDESFARTVGPFVAPFPVSVRTAGCRVADVARQWTRVVAAVNGRCAYPPADLVRHVEPFTGLPEDTYFTDPFIMFNNYQREETSAELRVEVLECLAPLSEGELTGLDAPTLVEIAGLFLIIDIWQDEPRFNFWYHQHRFTREQVADWADRYVAELRTALGEL
ncbi:SDR family NAD(P)-dependent oxidoreductase [Streptomyces virginiae]|uniref:SDR family NAD(P)-dependent oxidoreductase n=1 Tax=Streptomyces virginiae TaxID=1961 RepID=UPI0036A74A27